MGAPFRAAVEARDLEAMVAALSDDVVLHSPVTFKPFEGKESVRFLFQALLQVFEDFQYTDEFNADGKAILVFKARIGDRLAEGVDLIRYDEKGSIFDFTVMVRPLSAAMALGEAVMAKLSTE